MDKLREELVDVNFPHCSLFGCYVRLLLEHHPFQIYWCLTFWFSLLGVQNSDIVWYLVKTSGQNKSSSAIICYFLIKANLTGFFTSIRASPYNVTWKPSCSDCVMLNTFLCRSGIKYILYNVMRWIFPSYFWHPCQLTVFVMVSVPLYPMVNRFFT